ncbi:MAG: poly-beta-hydroxybutyrate polymerase N-terminal domain-containing protein, partial [Burkholderiaceae bacterium]|nr:poly-beta-hydroxybutyrate polymerase N-terminal domain-containing protein [Burkholderiaceae bacterium]
MRLRPTPASKAADPSAALSPGLPATPEPAVPRPLVGLPLERDSFAATALWDVVDRAVHAGTARATGGVSPAALTQAWMDWAIHLAAAPGKRMLLAQKAQRKTMRFASYALNCA